MRSFNDWYFDLFESGNGASLNQQEIAEEAWDYQQSKVDELQKQVTDLDNRATKYALDAMATAKLNAELQKRVDAALSILSSKKKMYVDMVIEIEQALKGGIE